MEIRKHSLEGMVMNLKKKLCTRQIITEIMYL